MNLIEWVICAAIVCILGATVYMAAAQGGHKERFMAECLQDHKQYECDMAWGQASGGGSGMATGMAVGIATGIAAGRR